MKKTKKDKRGREWKIYYDNINDAWIVELTKANSDCAINFCFDVEFEAEDFLDAIIQSY